MNDAELLKFMNEIEEHHMVEAPRNFREGILIQTNALPAKAVHGTKKLSKNMQLFLYTLKVCTAVIWVLFFLNFSQVIQLSTEDTMKLFSENDGRTITSVIAEKTGEIGSVFRALPGEILNLGGILNE